MDLQTRLEILNVSGAITDCTKDVMLNVINMFNEKHNIELTEDNGAMMVTHLSMAITRVKNGEPVITRDEEVCKESLESDDVESANLTHDDLSEVLDVTLPDDEKKYMLVNICVILEK